MWKNCGAGICAGWEASGRLISSCQVLCSGTFRLSGQTRCRYPRNRFCRRRPADPPWWPATAKATSACRSRQASPPLPWSGLHNPYCRPDAFENHNCIFQYHAAIRLNAPDCRPQRAVRTVPRECRRSDQVLPHGLKACTISRNMCPICGFSSRYIHLYHLVIHLTHKISLQYNHIIDGMLRFYNLNGNNMRSGKQTHQTSS